MRENRIHEFSLFTEYIPISLFLPVMRIQRHVFMCRLLNFSIPPSTVRHFPPLVLRCILTTTISTYDLALLFCFLSLLSACNLIFLQQVLGENKTLYSWCLCRVIDSITYQLSKYESSIPCIDTEIQQ